MPIVSVGPAACTAAAAAGRLIEHPDQPTATEIKIADNLFVKQYVVLKADTWLPQHSHTYSHVSMIATGAVRVWADGKPLGEFRAPSGVVIEAGVKHTFLTLEDNTTIYCIHDISRTGEVEVAEEHHLVD